MTRMKLWSYKEENPHRLKRVAWAIVNAFVFPLVSNRYRKFLLKLFGAKIRLHVRIYRSVKIYAPWNLEIIGEHGPVCIGPRVEIYNKDKVVFGNDIVVSQDSYICAATHDVTSPSMNLVTKPIVINDQVWIAAKATILPGVTVGEGVIVGACSVVSKDVPPWSIVVGNPAEVVKKRELKDE